MANFEGRPDEWHAAIVCRTHANGTSDLEFENGDTESDVESNRILELASDWDHFEKHSIDVNGPPRRINVAPWFKAHIKQGSVSHGKCRHIIAEAEAFSTAGEGWGRNRHATHATQDLEIASIPALVGWFETWIAQFVFPCLREIFYLGESRIRVDDAFIIKYDMDSQQRLDQHSDDSELSFIVPLNSSNCFEGGGTFFRAPSRTFHPHCGSALFFCGKWKHSGVAITSGTRFILAGFVHIESARVAAICSEIEIQEERASGSLAPPRNFRVA
jgi:hypothetical protein